MITTCNQILTFHQRLNVHLQNYHLLNYRSLQAIPLHLCEHAMVELKIHMCKYECIVSISLTRKLIQLWFSVIWRNKRERLLSKPTPHAMLNGVIKLMLAAAIFSVVISDCNQTTHCVQDDNSWYFKHQWSINWSEWREYFIETVNWMTDFITWWFCQCQVMRVRVTSTKVLDNYIRIPVYKYSHLTWVAA